ncbi:MULTISPECIES: CDIF630_02480 family spore surface protein [Pelosinus]|jgi:hypothetical protein|uniref:DUF3787 domain-containing protein n=1 Tax=Pelosinus fermentans B4 TaxID=1149862 RepID=I8RPA6_9FIRM|nr:MULTISPECIES: DUF3787 domain-containing protein [Pelosinus]EIW20995.1 Protein of unknown function DUF3787 [Pelosinus fermentans B4]EIW27137.1 hypothetical protein FA11_1156 [Pelosinus fermentans A11]OAM92946.1 Protein of unknown function DUF3787 [Pelosinus fermentans DSM 17108]SDQ61843.1 protein of unknown function [Pelosinus fermentans]
MTENRSKEKFQANPIERHETAAWRGHIEKTKPESNVPVPSEESVAEAREWVNTNSLS